MALPKLNTPLYDLELPILKKKIKFRPFLVKEEKILLMALESSSKDDILNAVKQIINNCIVTEGVDIDSLPLVDLEYLFLQLRSRSVSDVVTLRYKNNACTFDDGKPCGKELQVMVKLDEIEVKTSENHSKKIDLGDGIGIIMKYPKMDVISSGNLNSNEKLFDLIAESVETIYDSETTYDPSTFSKEELDDFILSMSQKQFEKIKEFFDTMPHLEKTVTVKCKKCGYSNDVTLRGLNDFFG